MESSKNAIAKNKLAILYILNKMDIRLSDTRLIEAADTLGLMDYFDLNSALHDLTENQLADMSTSINGTFYQITEMGKNTLEFFEKEISPEIKRDITNYLVTHSYEMRNESSTLADYYRTSNQDFAVHCMVKEGKTTLIELTFTVPTEAAAQTLCENWKKKSQEAYEAIMKLLM